jgi:polyribonucleotide nucleotidyltransferase
MNRSEIPQNADFYVSGLRNDSEIKTPKNPTQTCVMDSSYNHLQEQCCAALDTQSENIYRVNVEYIKVEADPLQIENDDTSSTVDTVQAFSDSIKYEPLASELVSDTSSHTKCEYTSQANVVSTASDTPNQTIQYRNNEKAADRTILPIDNLRVKCNETSVSKQRENDTEEIQDSIAAKFQGGTRNTAASSELGGQRYVFVMDIMHNLLFCFMVL